MYAMYACSLSALLKSRRDSASSGDVWKSIADIPVTWATCVSVQNRILAVGGRQPEKKEESRAIHMYDPLSQLFFFFPPSYPLATSKLFFEQSAMVLRHLVGIGGNFHSVWFTVRQESLFVHRSPIEPKIGNKRMSII